MLHFINFFVKKYDIVLNSNMINKFKLLIHDIYWACQLPFLKKKYTFEFDEEAFENEYNNKQKKVIEEMTEILSSFELSVHKENDEKTSSSNETDRQKFLDFFQKNNVKTHKIIFNQTMQSNLYLYQGFMPKIKGIWAFVLNIILLLNGNKVKLDFETDDMVFYNSSFEYHVFLFKIYSYLEYKYQYPFIEAKKNAKFIKLLTKSNKNLLKGLNMKEMKTLEKLMIYEKEALGFSIGVLRNNANIYEEANQNDK